MKRVLVCRVSILIAVTLTAVRCVPAFASWQLNGNGLCTAAGEQTNLDMIADSSGGTIVTWDGSQSGSYDVYVQRIDAAGNVQWTFDGVPICTATADQTQPQICSDGSGGAIIVWQDNRSGNLDIYVQRVDGSGNVLWVLNGVPVCTAAGDQSYPKITPDETGGAIITWQDCRSGNYSYDVYAQRVDAYGNLLWTPDGVAICTARMGQYGPQIAPDGAGGAIVTWVDARRGALDIYAQRVSTSGNVMWAADGIAIWEGSMGENPQIVTDGSGGAIITWCSGTNEGYGPIYAQRVDAFGNLLWSPGGLLVCDEGWLAGPLIDRDGAGGAILVWSNFSGSTSCEIYAQRLDAFGNISWGSNGVPVCRAAGYQSAPGLTTDGAGGATIAWMDSRSSGYDIYAQYVDASGDVKWGTEGTFICTATGDQRNPDIVSDVLGGAVIAWRDQRNGNSDIFAQRVACAVAPKELNFGQVSPNSSRDRNFVISNPGGVGFTGIVAAACSEFSVVAGSGPFTLEAGDSVTVTVRFAPISIGKKECGIGTGTALCCNVVCSGESWDRPVHERINQSE